MRYLSIILFLAFCRMPFPSLAQDEAFIRFDEDIVQDTIEKDNYFRPMSVKLNTLGIAWPYTNKLHVGYEHRLTKRASASILLEYGYFQDHRRDYDQKIREQYILYFKGFGATGEYRHYFTDPIKTVQFFIAPYLRYVSGREIRERYLTGSLIEYRSRLVFLIGGGLSGGMRVNLFNHFMYLEPLLGVGSGYDSHVTWLDFDSIILLSRIELSVGFYVK